MLIDGVGVGLMAHQQVMKLLDERHRQRRGSVASGAHQVERRPLIADQPSGFFGEPAARDALLDRVRAKLHQQLGGLGIERVDPLDQACFDRPAGREPLLDVPHPLGLGSVLALVEPVAE